MDYPRVNLQTVANEAIQPVQHFIVKNDLDKHQWQDSYRLVDMSIPDVVDAPTIKKKFKVQATFFDQATGKRFVKTIFFGQDTDYVFTKNKNQRLKKLSSMKHRDNPLHPNYWRSLICFASQDLKSNIQSMVDFILQSRLVKVHATKPKRDFKPALAKREATLLQKKKI